MISKKRLARGSLWQKPPKQRITASGNDLDGKNIADMIETALHLNCLEVWRLTGNLTGVAAGLFNEHIEDAPDRFVIEGLALLIEESLKPREAFRLHKIRDLVCQLGRGRSRTR